MERPEPILPARIGHDSAMRMFRRNENSLAAVAHIAVGVGAAGSIALMLYAGRRAPRLLIVLFTIWVNLFMAERSPSSSKG